MARLRLSRSAPLLALALAVPLSGCPSSTTAGGDVPIEMLGQMYGNVTCGVLVDCYGESIVRLFTGSSSEASCAARLAAGYTNGALPRYQAAISMGTMSYDASQAGACIDALNAQGCGVVTSRPPAACDALFVGHVAVGGACAIDEECQGNAYCSADTACPGTCQTFVSSGGTCTRDAACATGLRCGNGTCQAPGGAGASCQGGTGVECAGGLICAGGSTTATGTCRATSEVFAAGSGQACNVLMSQFCQEGLSCIVAGITSQTCGTGGLASGAACHPSVPDACAVGLYCAGTNPTGGDFDGTCTALPGDGMACATSVLGSFCADGTVCVSGTCRTVQANGGSCTDGAQCFSADCSSGTCIAPPYCP